MSQKRIKLNYAVYFLTFIFSINFNKTFTADVRLPVLPESEKKELAEKILNFNKDFNDLNGKPGVLSETAYRELNVIEGRTDNPDVNLFASIDRTTTLYGHEALKNLLVNPLSDTDKIKKRQKLIQRLANSPELMQKVDVALLSAAKHQENLLLLWSLKNPFHNQIDLLSALTQLTGTSNSKYAIESIRQITLGTSTAITTALVAATGYTAYALQNKLAKRRSQNQYSSFGKHKGTSTMAYLKPLILTAITGGWLYKFIPVLFRQEKNNKSMQELMISIATTLDASYKLESAISSLEESAQALDYTKDFSQYYKKTDKLNKELRELLTELSAKTFKDKASVFSFMGRVRRAYQLAYQLKDQLVPLLKAIGEIDAYVSTAKLIVEHNKKPNHYSFTEFLTAEHPIFDVKNSWNPIIDVEQIVTESIALGNGEGLIPNVLLTGPHGGGKSTFMKQLAYCVVLSQVFGIAPADSCKMTIFRFINTYLDIKDNPKKAMSAFMAERDRIQKLKHRIQGLPMDKFSFTLIDEPFKATMEKEASLLVSKFLTKIEQVTENISVVATHFIEPANETETRLNSRFVNFHMDVNERTPGRFQRFFKLKKGKCQWWFADNEKRQRYVNWLQTVLY